MPLFFIFPGPLLAGCLSGERVPAGLLLLLMPLVFFVQPTTLWFGDAHLERLYIHQQLHHHGAVLVYVLCVFTAALLLLALNHLPNPDMTLLLATISAACALALNILLNIQSAAHQHGCWLSTTVLCMLPAGGQHALLPVIIAHFALYTLFPFGIFPTLGICSTLSLAQITAFILLPSQSLFTLDQLRNHSGSYLEAAFLNARNALSSQQEALQENTKMLGTSVPKIYVEHYGQVSVIYAKIYGLQIILNQISDSARLLNEFNTRIDQLVKKMGVSELPFEPQKLVAVVIFLVVAGFSIGLHLPIYTIVGRDPLPDVVFSLIPEQPWALGVGDLMVTFCALR
uniref:Uncharacterized protein n=1 Tax=Ditylenchus dipsaci TaxID=166011 RepID=A0A915CMX6_9BILA